MQAIIKTLNFINNYIGYLYIVVFIAVVAMLVKVLLAMIELSHSATDFDMAMESINESCTNITNYKKRVRSTFSKTLRVIAAFKLLRIYLSRKNRAELHKDKDDVTLREKRDKYVKRLLKG